MPPTYAALLKTVSRIWDKASNTAATEANEAILQARWEIGRRILETEHTEAGRGDYGKRIIIKLAQDLRKRYGPGFGERNLRLMRLFHRTYKQTEIQKQLSWTHYARLLDVNDAAIRKTLEDRAVRERWSVDELMRQIRLAALKNLDTTPSLTRPEGELFLYNVKHAQYGPWKPDRPLIDCGFYTWLDQPTPGVRSLNAGDVVRVHKTRQGYRYERADEAQTRTFLYTCQPFRLIDGDTLTVHVDLGFGIHLRQTLRLRNLDAPEMITREGKRAAQYVQQALRGCTQLVIQTQRNDKYGRYLAHVLFKRGAKTPEEIYNEGRFLNQELLEEGLAIPA